MKKSGGKLKIIITFGILFVTVSVLLALIFFAGQKTYTVTFDLNGGTLISGSLTQTVTRGQDATPPTVVKDGSYLRAWSRSVLRVTKDMEVVAIWEYETTPGIIYADNDNQNFAEIAGAYPYIRGDVYLGAYYGDKKVLGIKDGAFADHTGISRVFMLDGLFSIGSEAFSGCTALTEIEIPRTVTNLGEGAFEGCSALKKATLRSGITAIHAKTFKGCKSLTEIVIPEGVTHIGEEAFSGCTSLERVVLPEGLRSIGKNAFKGCTSLIEIEVPASVTAIEEGAFANCRSLVNVILHEGLLSIGNNAFRGCTKLDEITVPESVSHIGEDAFAFKKIFFDKDFPGIHIGGVKDPILRPVDPLGPDFPFVDIETEPPDAEPESDGETETEATLETFIPIFRPRQTLPLPPSPDGD